MYDSNPSTVRCAILLHHRPSISLGMVDGNRSSNCITRRECFRFRFTAHGKGNSSPSVLSAVGLLLESLACRPFQSVLQMPFRSHENPAHTTYIGLTKLAAIR